MESKNQSNSVKKPLIDRNNKKHFLFSWGLIVLFAGLATWLVAGIFAAGPRVTLSSSDSSVKKNQSFDVTVGVEAGATQITVGQVYLTFDPNKVSLVSTDFSSSSFNAASPDEESGEGYVKMSRYQFPPPYPSGNIEVGKVRFTSLIDSGEITINVDTSTEGKTFLGSAENGADVTAGADTLTISAIQDTEPEEPPVDNGEPINVSYSLSSDRAAIKKGDIVKISSYIDSGSDGVSIAKNYITFNPNHFEFVSRDYSNSSFTNEFPDEEKEGSGFVSIARFTPPPFPAGGILIGSVNLRAIGEGVRTTISNDINRTEVFSGETGKKANNTSTNEISIGIAKTSAYEPPTDEPSEPQQPSQPGSSNNTGGGSGTVGGGSTSGQTGTVGQGTPITVSSPATTSSGEQIRQTDVYLNGEYQGTSTSPSDPVTIDTNSLEPGAYEITTRSQGVNGGTEESSQSFNLESQSIFVKYRLPFVVSAVSVLAIIAGFILKSLYFHAVPFYKTIH